MADDLTAWLTQIWDEREEMAKQASPGPWRLNAEHDEVLAADDIEVCTAFALSNNQLRWTARHIAANDPASVLARIAAGRQILADWQQANGEHQSWCEEYDDFGAIEDYGRADKVRGALESLERIVRLLAQPYADRPGYLEEWRPE